MRANLKRKQGIVTLKPEKGRSFTNIWLWNYGESWTNKEVLNPYNTNKKYHKLGKRKLSSVGNGDLTDV